MDILDSGVERLGKSQRGFADAKGKFAGYYVWYSLMIGCLFFGYIWR